MLNQIWTLRIRLRKNVKFDYDHKSHWITSNRNSVSRFSVPEIAALNSHNAR